MNEKVTMGIRILFGIMCVVFGANKFLNFMPPFEMEEQATQLMGIYMDSGFMNIIGALEVLAGLALLINKFVPLALTILAAIMFNAFLFHLLHSPAGIAGAILGCILTIILVYAYKDRFKSILSA